MGKVSQSVCIALLITVVNSLPLEDKPKDTSTSPHVLIAQPQTLVNDHKDHSLSRESTSETILPKREEPEKPRLDQPAQNENQGSTPKPVHHYRDGPIIQRRDADKSSSEEKSASEEKSSSEEKKSNEESDESHEKKSSETPNRQRRDTRDENKEKENQSTYERSNPSVLASNPNIQTPAYLPTPKSAVDNGFQKDAPISRTGSSSQYGASSSSAAPDLIPASSTHLHPLVQNQDEKQTEDQNQQNSRDQQYNQRHPYGDSSNQNRKVTEDKVTNEKQQRETRDLTHSQNHKATEAKHDSKNQQQKNVHENPPHLSASHWPSISKNRK